MKKYIFSLLIIIPFIVKSQDYYNIDGNYIMPGINVGITNDVKFFLGVECSAVKYEQEHWVGIFGDALFNSDHARITLGPEIGFRLIGFEPGYFISFDDNRYYHGINGRASFTLAFIQAYIRYGYAFILNDDFYEIGLLLKIPVKL